MKKILFLPVILLFLIPTSCGTTPEGAAVTGVVGGKLAKDIISDLEKTAQVMLNNATQNANASVAQAANQLNVLAQNLRIELADELDKNIEKLSEEHQKLLTVAENYRITVENLKNDAFKFEKILKLDVKEILGEVLPWSKSNFSLEKIDGVTQLIEPFEVPDLNPDNVQFNKVDNSFVPQKISDTATIEGSINKTKVKPTDISYKFILMGKGFGTNLDKYSSKIKKIIIGDDENSVTLKDNEFRENKTESYVSNLEIATKSINKILDKNNFNKVKILISVETESEKGFIFKNKEIKVFDFVYYVTFLPRKIKDIVIYYTTEKFDFASLEEKKTEIQSVVNELKAHSFKEIIAISKINKQIEKLSFEVPKMRTETYKYLTPNHHQDKKPILEFTYQNPHSVNNNERYVSYKRDIIDPKGSGCAWTRWIDLDIIKNGTTLMATFATSGQPCLYTYGARIETKVPITRDGIATVDFAYDSIVEFDLPANTKTWRIEGIAPNKDRINLTQNGSYGNLIVFNQVKDVGSFKRITYQVRKPF